MLAGLFVPKIHSVVLFFSFWQLPQEMRGWIERISEEENMKERSVDIAGMSATHFYLHTQCPMPCSYFSCSKLLVTNQASLVVHSFVLCAGTTQFGERRRH